MEPFLGGPNMLALQTGHEVFLLWQSGFAIWHVSVALLVLSLDQSRASSLQHGSLDLRPRLHIRLGHSLWPPNVRMPQVQPKKKKVPRPVRLLLVDCRVVCLERTLNFSWGKGIYMAS